MSNLFTIFLLTLWYTEPEINVAGVTMNPDKLKESDELADQVAAFLAKGGEIEKMRDCSPKESMYKSFPPHKYFDKRTGKMKIYRNKITHKQPKLITWSANTK